MLRYSRSHCILALQKLNAALKWNPGEQPVSLQGLAANFDINQLQYQTSGIDVNAVSHTDSADKPAGNESARLKTEIEQVRDQISAQNAIIQSAELQNKFLTNITKGSARKSAEAGISGIYSDRWS